jgi:transporter family-2 protein
VNGLIIAANIVTSIAIDHFGLLNTPVHTASIWRIVGGALMVGGIALVSKF